jgi:hypothetical protein
MGSRDTGPGMWAEVKIWNVESLNGYSEFPCPKVSKDIKSLKEL